MAIVDSKQALITTLDGKFVMSLYLDNYELSTLLRGGDGIAQFSIAVPDQKDRVDLVTKILGCRIELNRGYTTWNGVVSEIEFSAGYTTSYRLSLGMFGNRIRTRYKASSIVDGEELLTNRSFELLNSDGKPESWDVSDSGWSINDSTAYHANRCIDITDGSISVKLSEPDGGMFLLSFWYKNGIQVTVTDTDQLDDSDNPVEYFSKSYSAGSWTNAVEKIPVHGKCVLTFSATGGNGSLDLASCLKHKEIVMVTDWADDVQSQSLYGILEREVDFTNVVSNELSAIHLRDMQNTKPSIQVTGFGDKDTISVTCVGTLFDLNRRIVDIFPLLYKTVQDAVDTDDTLYLNNVDDLAYGNSLFTTVNSVVTEYIIDSIDDVLNTVTFTDTLDVDIPDGTMLYRYRVSDLITELVQDAGYDIQIPDIDTVVESLSGNTVNSIISELLEFVSTEDKIYSYTVSNGRVLVVYKIYALGYNEDYIITEVGYTSGGSVIPDNRVTPGYFRDISTAIFLPRFLVDEVTWMYNTDNPDGKVELSISSNNNTDERMWRYVLRTMKEGNYDLDLSRA